VITVLVVKLEPKSYLVLKIRQRAFAKCIIYTLAIAFKLYNYEEHSFQHLPVHALSNYFAPLKCVKLFFFKIFIYVVVAFERLFSFVLDHRN